MILPPFTHTSQCIQSTFAECDISAIRAHRSAVCLLGRYLIAVPIQCPGHILVLAQHPDLHGGVCVSHCRQPERKRSVLRRRHRHGGFPCGNRRCGCHRLLRCTDLRGRLRCNRGLHRRHQRFNRLNRLRRRRDGLHIRKLRLDCTMLRSGQCGGHRCGCCRGHRRRILHLFQLLRKCLRASVRITSRPTRCKHNQHHHKQHQRARPEQQPFEFRIHAFSFPKQKQPAQIQAAHISLLHFVNPAYDPYA